MNRHYNYSNNFSLTILLLFLNSVLYAAPLPVVDVSNIKHSSSIALSASRTLIEAKNTVRNISEMKNKLQAELKSQFNLQQLNSEWNPSNWTNTDLRTQSLIKEISLLNEYENYLKQFQTTDYYQKNYRCLSSQSACSQQEWQATQRKLVEHQRAVSVAKKKSHEAWLRGLKAQQQSLEDDAKKLKSIQSKSASAKGRRESLQYANQINAHQAHQLSQIRGQMIAEQNARAVEMQARADREAMQAAALERSLRGEFKPSRNVAWSFKP